MLCVKICGVTRVEDARAAVRAGADALGLNFVRESPRFIGGLDQARALVRAAALAERTAWAGVFVNPPLPDVLAAVEAAGLRIVQLHGEESPAFLRSVKDAVGPAVAVWKAFRIAAKSDLDALRQYECDACLLDARAPGVRGGSGKTFDWGLLAGVPRVRPLVLAGGLTPANVGDAVRAVRPEWVDTAGGVESAPGIKDAAALEAFIRAARAAVSPSPCGME
jgi:phosphoribosylanthranilate isomerase